MNQIAFIIGDHFLYWNSIILTLAVISSMILFWALAVRKREDRGAAVIAIPLAFLLSLVFSRLLHWYCRPQGYENMLKALVDYSRGGYALAGVFAGCLLTAVLLRLFGASHNLPRLLDQMAIAGALGIAVGRLAALFTTADRGVLMPDFVPFPVASRFQNAVSGEIEVRLAVFMFQAIIAAILFVILICGYLKGEKTQNLRPGDTCLNFLLWYCGTQAVLDSPRYDSLYFRSNGFVSVVQIFGVLTVVLVLVLYTVRLCKAKRFKKLYLTFLALPFLGLAGYMEYHVQRHGSQALFSYTVMSLSMLTAMILIHRIYAHAVNAERQAVRQTYAPRNNFYARQNMAYERSASCNAPAYSRNPGYGQQSAACGRDPYGQRYYPQAPADKNKDQPAPGIQYEQLPSDRRTGPGKADHKRSGRHYQGKFSSPRG